MKRTILKKNTQPKGALIGQHNAGTTAEENSDDQMESAETVAEKRKRLDLKVKTAKLKMQYKNWKIQMKQQLSKSLGSELTNILVIILVLGTIYYGLFIAYLWIVHVKFSFVLYYPQFATEQPGAGQDQRINWFWFLLAASLLRLPLSLTFIWLMRRLGVSWKMNIYIVLFIITIILEGLCLLGSFLLWAFCNNPYIPSNYCNDLKYCEVYGLNHTAYCPAGSYTGLSADFLKPRPEFVYYIIFNGIFIALGGLMFLMVPSIMDFKTNSQTL